MAEELKRHFGGVLRVIKKQDMMAEYRHIRNFEGKHLRAYLRADSMFSYGHNEYHNPQWFKVKEIWK